jgi:hypothetical protein
MPHCASLSKSFCSVSVGEVPNWSIQNIVIRTHKQHSIKSTEIIRIFFRRNLQIKNEHTKSMTHKSLIRSNLEYYSTISPHTCMREEDEFEVDCGCAEGFVSKTMTSK